MIDMSNVEQVTKKLQELKDSKLPHMTIEQFSKIDGYFAELIQSATEEEKAKITEQLYLYYKHEENNNCIFTGTSPILSWTLAHGVAQDEISGLMWHCYHYFTIAGKEYKFQRTLQCHPDGYSLREEE